MLIKYICDDCGHGFEKENNLDPICPVCGVAQLVNDGFKPKRIMCGQVWNGKKYVDISLEDMEDILNDNYGGD